jgi:Antitoxin VbhA
MDAQNATAHWRHEQALASAVLEGFKPDAEFLADSLAAVEGHISQDEVRSRALARARSLEAAG